ncbi:MAG TPA: 7-carboxy-7-deazaguanine synthase QueE [Chitinophagaceae bacterium]
MDNEVKEINVAESKNIFLLPLMEAFYTIQGEGFHQGKAAYFIRLAGCDVGCVWCDVKESWNADAHPKKSIEDIVAEIKKTPAQIVVVTGGEPLMHDLTALTATLKKEGLKTNIETSGAYPLTGQWDWICVSPKKFKAPLKSVLSKANELKVVIFNKSDFDWAEKHAAQVNALCKLYLQPEWSKVHIMTPFIVDYIKTNPQWELSLQIHKYIDVP